MSVENNINDNIDDNIDYEVDGYIVDINSEGKRLDVYVSEQYKDMSRSFIQKLIKDEKILVNSKCVKASYKLASEDEVTVSILEEAGIVLRPQDIELDIIYEDDSILIVNKPQGMVVHPAPGNPDSTLVNALLYHCGNHLSTINGDLRPGIVHRIDKYTSGLLVVAKDDESHKKLAEQFSLHSITREYEMIAIGGVDWSEKTVDAPIGRNPKNRFKRGVVAVGGKRAVTHFKVEENLSGFTYMTATLETGRTHQIRVHLSHLCHPILGDGLYGYSLKKFSSLKGQMLHARKLGFIHPKTGKYLEFCVGHPKYFEKVLEIIRQ